MNRREASKIETRNLTMAAARKMLLGKDLKECTPEGNTPFLTVKDLYTKSKRNEA